ncbi:MAG: DUF503 domain-containing protein [Thermacetogeniaceae bacterium]
MAVIGLCTLELFIGEANSLKDKRRVLKSMLEKIRARFNVSIAEVGQQELWQRSTVAFACVSNERAHADQMLGAVVRFMEQMDAQITSCQTEIL